MNPILTIALVCLLVDASSADVTGQDEEKDDLPEAPEDLIHTFVIFVEGPRSPKKDIFNSESDFEKLWPKGKERLTEVGQVLMGRVGRSLKTRYNKKIPEFNEKRFTATSNERLAAIDSVDRVLKSMYEIPQGFKWMKREYTLEGKDDKLPQRRFGDNCDLFESDEKNTRCKHYTLLKDRNMRKEMKKLSTDGKDVIKKINGEIKKKKLTLDDVFHIYDTYQMMKLNNKKLPGWVIPLLSKMEKIVQSQLLMRVNPFLQYYTGTLLFKILSNMVEEIIHSLTHSQSEKTGDVPDCEGIHLHGSDDVTVTALVWALVKDTEYMASPGDTLMFEASSQDMTFELFLYSPLKPDPKERFKRFPTEKLCNEDSCSAKDMINKLKPDGLYLKQEEWEKKCKVSVIEYLRLKTFRDRFIFFYNAPLHGGVFRDHIVATFRDPIVATFHDHIVATFRDPIVATFRDPIVVTFRDPSP
ncbi:uncharacterized protein LOC128996661 [Macrosteles quadrilineatus]|uniref:uncharacterized protein LOC128996661 n=1 Tax=Macrosteles quadrilineatus TaxID=74068 RepID=UPI0023E268F7|nr:uncharacterized protein LOC128996661 [Macrosteles quadrilineatus]